jgi:hypothetical protein
MPAQQNYLVADCVVTQVALESAVQQKTHKDQSWSWNRWTQYCGWIGLLDLFLDNIPRLSRIKLVGTFAMALHEARFSGPSYDQLAHGSVTSAISHVCQTFREHRQPNPSLDDNRKPGFLLQWELRSIKKANPTKKHQKAIPMSVISTMAKQKLSELDHAIAQLTGLGMFFAFQSCKYLKVPQAEQGQTEILKMRNIRFFKDGTILPHFHPDLEFADCISLTFECQKRQDKHNTVTQEATGDSVLCPVRFAAGLVRCITSYPGTSPNTNISTYMSNSSVKHLTSGQVINTLHDAICAIGKAHLGISKEKIGTHSIRLGAAMAMYLGECPVYTIMLINQWSSDTLLWCIRKQVMEFSHNASKRMLTFQNYRHIPNFDHRVSANDPCVRNNPNNAKTSRNVSDDTSRLMQLPAFSQFS